MMREDNEDEDANDEEEKDDNDDDNKGTDNSRISRRADAASATGTLIAYGVAGTGTKGKMSDLSRQSSTVQPSRHAIA